MEGDESRTAGTREGKRPGKISMESIPVVLPEKTDCPGSWIPKGRTLFILSSCPQKSKMGEKGMRKKKTSRRWQLLPSNRSASRSSGVNQ